MTKQVLFVLIVLMGLSGYAQTRFESGYYIKNDGSKIDCFIKNMDWRNNPTKFEYRHSSESEIQYETIDRVNKFVISDKLVYERFTVAIDTSSSLARSMDHDKNPKLKEEMVFLKALVKGNASLYTYRESLLVRYFYSLNDETPQPLIYKKYLFYNKKNGREEIKVNNQFRRQLLIDLKCDKITTRQLEGLDYNEKELVNLFEKYNSCLKPDDQITTTTKKNKKKDLFNLSVKGGLKFASLVRTSAYSEIDFGNQTNPHLGIEAEFILPFNNGKWSLLIEPTYFSYKAEADAPIDPFFTSIALDYSALTFPIGLRHSFYLNDNSKLYLNVLQKFYISDISFKDYIKFLPGPTQGKSDLRNQFILGGGLKFKNSSLELRYGSNALFNSGYSKKYSELSIIYGHSIF